MGHPVAGQQWGSSFTKMKPSELLPLAGDRTSDPNQRAHVEEIAASIKRSGYQAKKHDAFEPKLSTHIHVVHTDEESYVWNGNHRVAALGLAGYTKPVPVRVSDFRSKNR
jgi:ParB-like chromosome segregation protein Spo0J